jgi:trigger factor
VVVDIFRDKGIASCTVTVEAERVQKAFEQAYGEAAQNVKIPGFRRGKAPLSVLRSRLDESKARSRVLDVLLPEAIKECLERHNLKPMGRPTLENYSLQEGEDLVFQMSLVERPEVKLGDCEGLEVSLPQLPDAKKEATETLDRLRNAETSLLPKEGEVEGGEVVEVHLEYWQDGELRMVREKAHLDLEQPTLNAALRQGLIGAKVGEEREFEDLPEDASSKTGRYKVVVKGVFQKNVPEVTPEWVRARFGKQSVEVLLQEIEEQTIARAQERAQKELKESLLREACSRAETEVPTYSTIRLASSRLATFVDELRESGFSLEERGSEGPTAVEQVFADILEKSREAIKERLVVNEIAQREKIEVSEEEVAERLRALRPNLDEDDPDRDALVGRVESELLREKVMDFLFAKAVVRDADEGKTE